VCSIIQLATAPYGTSFIGAVETLGTDPLSLGLTRGDINAQAHVFVSHARLGSFSQLVSAIEEFAVGEEGQALGGEEGLYVWLDILVLDQNDCSPKAPDFFDTTFMVRQHLNSTPPHRIESNPL
jgi:hypothetical protein